MYPVVLVAAFLLTELIEVWPPVTLMLRASVVLITLTILLQLGLGAVAGRDRGALLASLFVLSAVDFRIAGLVVLVALLPVLYHSLKQRRLMAVKWSFVTRIVNVIAVVSFVLGVFNVARTAIGAGVPTPVIQARPAADPAAAPDIYLVLLDGYPRVDTIREAIGYDNRAFLAEMERFGFDVADESHSNYQRTVLTLASMLNARHVSDLMPIPPEGYIRQNAQLSSWMREPEAVNVARALGYEFVVIPTFKVFVTPSAPDRLIDSGHLTEFEFLLQRGGWLGLVARGGQDPWLHAEQRLRIIDAFGSVTTLAAERAGRPKLVLAHFLTPHHPILFRRDGSLADVANCTWDDCPLDDPLSPLMRDALSEQVEYTNELVRRTVREIVDKSPRPPVIIVFGDHGFRHWLSDDPETFQNLFMSYTPGHLDLFAENTTLINVLPRILNAYLHADLPLASEDLWVDVERNGYFPLEPWPGG